LFVFEIFVTVALVVIAPFFARILNRGGWRDLLLPAFHAVGAFFFFEIFVTVALVVVAPAIARILFFPTRIARSIARSWTWIGFLQAPLPCIKKRRP
jgi:hypothetical protein